MIEVVDLLYKNPHELIKTPNQEESKQASFAGYSLPFFLKK